MSVMPSEMPSSENASSESAEPNATDVRVSKPRRAQPADAVRPTRAEINLGHLRHNLRAVERATQNGASGPEVWPVLKADAYGHGAPAVARTLERAGAKGLCVALLEEGVELREAGIRIPILVMGGYYGPQHRGLEDVLAHDLIPVIYQREQVERLRRITSSGGPAGDRARVHLKVDTGMGRLGAPLDDLDELLGALRSTPSIVLDGLMSHLACADGADLEPTLAQLRRFEAAKESVASAGFAPRTFHIANSAGALRLPELRMGMIRPGIAIYGVAPCDTELLQGIDLKPVMRVRSEIVAIRTLQKGERVGYGHTFEADSPRVIATIAMGYADGLSRALSNRGHVLVRGKRAPIAGVVSMDLTSIDVTDIRGAEVGDEAVVMGSQSGPLGSDAITAEELAAHASTIAWEPLTHISRRVPRFYREP